jgi:hypothetical protein
MLSCFLPTDREASWRVHKKQIILHGGQTPCGGPRASGGFDLTPSGNIFNNRQASGGGSAWLPIKTKVS